MKNKIENSKEVQILEIQNQNVNNNNPVYDFYFGITLPGRIIITLYSLHGLFFIYNIIIQYIISIPSILYFYNFYYFLKIIFSIIYLIFAINSSNILLIPSFEFFSFPFLMYKNPICHLISFVYIYKEEEFNEKKIKDQNSPIINIIFIIIEVSYFIGLILGYISDNTKYKDYTKIIILSFMYCYYLTILLCYFFISLYLIIMISKNSKFFFIYFRKNINLYFKDKPDLPEVNLLSYIINPFLLKNYSEKNGAPIEDNDNSYYFEDFIYTFQFIIKFIMFIISFGCFIFIYFDKVHWFYLLLGILIFFIMTILSLTLNFPFCYRNRKTFGVFGCCCNSFLFSKRNNIISTNIKYNHNFYHPFIVSMVRFIWDIIIFLVALVLLFIYFRNDEDTKNSNIFYDLVPEEVNNNNKDLLLPNICFSSIHNIPILSFIPFINDAYYYNNFDNKKSSLEIENYKKLFFGDDYQIEVMGNLIKEENKDEKSVKMIQYNVRNDKNFITILSIKGTSYNRDIYLDAQLYFSSILLKTLTTFSVMTQKETLSFKLMEFSLSIPYRIFFKYLMIDKYINKLQEAFIENEYSFYKNVVIVGHSLGGGLAKLFGRFIGKQAISLSGPGINAFHSLWKFEGSSENFGISAIDLVPDKDLVPRVEVSGGTIYRIICIEGVLDCHSKEMSLCELLIMCRNPNYKIYCNKFVDYSDEKINKIIKISELNKKKNKK